MGTTASKDVQTTSSSITNMSAGITSTSLGASPKGLPAFSEPEWLLDCYRLRVDDDANCGKIRGLQAAAYHHDDEEVFEAQETLLEGKAYTVLTDFLLFTKLAARGCGFTSNFPFDSFFLKAAIALYDSRAEAADIDEKWGVGAATKLRAIAYGLCDDESSSTVFLSKVRNALDDEIETKILPAEDDTMKTWWRNAAFFEDIGGVEHWKNLFVRLGGRVEGLDGKPSETEESLLGAMDLRYSLK